MMLKLSNLKHHLKGFSGEMFFGFGFSNHEDKKHVGLAGMFWSCPIFVEEMNSCLWIAALKIHSGRQLQIVIHPLVNFFVLVMLKGQRRVLSFVSL